MQPQVKITSSECISIPPRVQKLLVVTHFVVCRGFKIAQDVAAGLVYLHANRIIHLDLKSPNILLGADNTAKIADVGLGKILTGRNALATSVGTMDWAAPEQLQGSQVSEASDMFSFGTILWELVTGERPHRRNTRPVMVPDECPTEIAELIAACHRSDPKLRPSAKWAYSVIQSFRRQFQRTQPSPHAP